MRKASSTEPPRYATWLLEKFSPVLDNPPLTGDLVEAFKQGRSSGWYWRQVLAAILVALAKLMRRSWGYLVYAVGWGGFISVAWYFTWTSSRHASALSWIWVLYARGFGIQWPWSLAYQVAFVTIFQAINVSIALGAYLAFFHIWKPQDLVRISKAIVVTLAGTNLAFVFVSAITGRFTLPFWVEVPLWLGVSSTPSILVILLGMWNFRPCVTSPSTKA